MAATARKLTKAGREAISRAQKKRWAAWRKKHAAKKKKGTGKGPRY